MLLIGRSKKYCSKIKNNVAKTKTKNITKIRKNGVMKIKKNIVTKTKKSNATKTKRNKLIIKLLGECFILHLVQLKLWRRIETGNW